MLRFVPRFSSAAALSVGAYVVFAILAQTPSLRTFPTTLSADAPWLGSLFAALTPDAIASASWDSPTGLAVVAAFGMIAAVLVALWAVMLWRVRTTTRPALGRVLGLVLLCSVPLLCLLALFSDDLYLYAFYGRIIGEHGGNPLLTPPSAFYGDPLLWHVPWPDATSAYGPLWVLIAAGLSRLADDSLTWTVLVYRTGGLAIHLLTTIVIHAAVRERRPDRATWAAVFYGLNPLVLAETVGNAHSDALLGLLLASALWAVARGRVAVAGTLLGAAVMTKAPVVVVLAPMTLAVVLARRTVDARLRVFGVLALATTGTALALYAPVWAGTAILDNIRSNPASHEYLNSVWQLVLRGADMMPDERFVQTGERLTLTIALLVAMGAALFHVWRGRALEDAVGWTWLAFCGLLSWVWPWYFVPLCAVAAMSVSMRLAWATGAITLGGLLFWMGWTGPPHPDAPWLVSHRALLFFGPALIVATPCLVAATSAAVVRLAQSPPWLPTRFDSVTRVPRDLESVDG